MDKAYLARRKKRSYTKYRLDKRSEVIIDALKEFAADGAGLTLEVGTADGEILQRIAAYFKLKRVFGIDVSEEAIRIAHQLNNIKVALGEFTQLPFKDGAFDIIIAAAVVEHIEDIDAALKETCRVLKSGGVLCITLPNPVYDWINSKLVRTYHLRRYSLKKIIKVLEQYGFKVIKANYFMFWPFGKVVFNDKLERLLRLFKSDFLLFNHITIGRKI